MQRIYADKYIEIGEQLAGIRVIFNFTDQAKAGEAEKRLTDLETSEIKTAIKDLIKICDTINFKVSGDILSKVYDDLPRTGREFDMITATVVSELKNQTFLYVPSHKASFYENDALVSQAVLESFPMASAELRMAGNCFATGLNTACVFHCMRAAEIGVWALGHALGVSFPDKPVEQADIHPILEQVESKIKAQKNLTRSAEKDETLKFYSEAATQFRYFKDGWRVRVAHARATHEEAAALKIFDHTKDFFEDLAPKLFEKGSLTELLS